MKNILLATIPALLVGVSTYAWIPSYTPEQLAERENKQTIKRCIDSISYDDTVNQIQRAIEICKEMELIQVITPKVEKSTTTGSVMPEPSKTVEEAKERFKLAKLHQDVCKKQINSPLCNDRMLFDRLYQITEERLPGRNFYPILLGIMNAESSLGLDFAKDNTGGTCFGRNNWGGTKYQINDDNTRTYSRELNGFKYGTKYSGRFVDQYGCNLYPFESIEEFFITKVNGMRFGYKGCVDSKTPIKCLSYQYVGDPNISEESWRKNVGVFLE